MTTGTNTTNQEKSIDSKNDAISLLPSRSFTSTSSPPRLPNDDFPNRDATRVMIAGCGNSLLPFDMIQAGWTGGIVGIDFSSIVISQMKIKALQSQTIIETAAAKSKQPEDILKFSCADLTQPLPEYADESFDLIIVKGSFDAILCSNGSRASTLKLVQNCVRLLSSDHGVLFLVTTGNPDNRLEYLEHQNDLTHYWRNVSVHPLRNATASSCQPSYVMYSYFTVYHFVQQSYHVCITITRTHSPVYCYICRKRSGIPQTIHDAKIIPSGKENVVRATGIAND